MPTPRRNGFLAVAAARFWSAGDQDAWWTLVADNHIPRQDQFGGLRSKWDRVGVGSEYQKGAGCEYHLFVLTD